MKIIFIYIINSIFDINKNIPQIKVNTPDSTYLLWLNCKSLGFDGDELLDFFLDEAKLAPNDGRIFGDGGDGYMRINVACSRKVLTQALYQLRLAVDKHNSQRYLMVSGC